MNKELTTKVDGLELKLQLMRDSETRFLDKLDTKKRKIKYLKGLIEDLNKQRDGYED